MSLMFIFGLFNASITFVTVQKPSKAITADDLLRNFILRALAISLLIHLLAFGVWKWGQAHKWWQTSRLPRWMQLAQNKVIAQVAKKLPPQPQPPKSTPLLFVDVDPSLAVPTPPKEKKYYSTANTEAANPEKKINSDIPQINGEQDKVLKTTDFSKSKAQPLQPSPPKPQEPKPEPVETKPPQPEPQKTQSPGDLAFAKPQDKAQDGKAQTEKVEKKPEHTRPKTLNEALERQGLRGEKMKQNGGVERTAISSSLDVARSACGDYDRDFIEAVQNRWDQLLQNQSGNMPGKVVVEFRLYFDGRITDMKVIQNEVTDLLALYCQKAILDPAPYKRWPPEMRAEINKDYREIRFTFYYLNPGS